MIRQPMTRQAAESVEREEAGGEISSVGAEYGIHSNEVREDRLRTPRFERIDTLLNKIASSFDRISPMIARVADDGAYARTLLGFMWLLVPFAAVAVGIASAFNTNFVVMIPSLELVIAICILGVIDAFAGMLFTLSFGTSSLARWRIHLHRFSSRFSWYRSLLIRTTTNSGGHTTVPT
jgi:hypothetical protein